MSDVLSWIRLPGPFLIGHRGFPAAARENTPASFEAALEAGADGVEFDVRFTRDGVAVIHHDEAVPGAGGPLLIAHATWEELHSRGGTDAEGIYRVHRAEEIAEQLSGRCLLEMEVKPVEPERREQAAAGVVALLERIRPRESVLVSSFDPDLLHAIHRRDRSVALGRLVENAGDLSHLEEHPSIDAVVSLHVRHDLVDRRLVRRARERSLQVHAWTVNDAAEADRLLALGVEVLITDRPDQWFRFLHSAMPGS